MIIVLVHNNNNNNHNINYIDVVVTGRAKQGSH